MQTKEIKLFTYDELSDKAKEKAREWWEEVNECRCTDYLEDMYDNDVENWGLPGMKVYFHLGYTQSDDVNFEGSIDLDALTSAHTAGNLEGEEADRYFASDEYRKVGEAYTKLKATGATDISASYKLSRAYSASTEAFVTCVDTEGCYREYGEDAIDELAEALTELARGELRTQFMQMGYAQIEWESSEENVAETMAVNEYTFLEDGKRFG